MSSFKHVTHTAFALRPFYAVFTGRGNGVKPPEIVMKIMMGVTEEDY